MEKLSYRPEIDGLRAIAVLMVVLFHAGFGFSGGYVGVDVFFVISGFLITSLILKAQQQNQFRLKDFWLRRIRRLVPALLVMQVIVLAVGCWTLLPEDLKDLADSSIAQILLAANFYFADKLDYFAGPAELMPLLHTWSLAVEEQFYLLLPLLLVFCRRLSRGWLLGVLASLAVVSFALSTWGLFRFPQATFFLLSSRAWELLIGSLLAMIPIKPQPTVKQNNLLSMIGLTGIVSCALVFDGTTPFPGPAALLPCLSTALFIFATGRGRTYAGQLLATKWFVGVGLISYSLYLWHWPVMVFAKYQFGSQLSPALSIAAIAISFLLGYLSWKYVETPFRRRQVLPVTGTMLRVTAAAAVSIVLVAGVFSLLDGLPQRWDSNILSLLDNRPDRSVATHSSRAVRRDELPTLGSAEDAISKTPAVLLWGDSHALSIHALCDDLAKEHHIMGLAASRGGTVPLLQTWQRGYEQRYDTDADERQWNNEVVDLVRRKNIQHVILVARWALYVEANPDGSLHERLIKDEQSVEHSPSESQMVLRRGLERTIDQLHAAGAKVWIVKQVPLQDSDPVRELVFAARQGQVDPPRGVTRQQHQERQASVNRVLSALASPDVIVLDPADYCFDEYDCSIIGSRDRSYYYDDDHLSPHGSRALLRPLLEPVFAEIAREERYVVRTGDAVRSRAAATIR